MIACQVLAGSQYHAGTARGKGTSTTCVVSAMPCQPAFESMEMECGTMIGGSYKDEVLEYVLKVVGSN